jgi:hypothetical protein
VAIETGEEKNIVSMHRILDLDLDFFVHPTAHSVADYDPHRDESDYAVDAVSDVQSFLGNQCKITADRNLPGGELVHHVGAFWLIERWLRQGMLVAPFEIVHVDAHADIGLGEASWVYLLSDFLALPLAARREPPQRTGALTSGNYLTFLIANRWVKKLTYVFPRDSAASRGVGTQDEPGDLLTELFLNLDSRSGIIALPHFSREEVEEAFYRTPRSKPLSVEPPVEFSSVTKSEYRAANPFTHVILAQSPSFVPLSALALLPVLRRYFREI